MTRLGTLPVEIETGRWENKPRAERLCRLECNEAGDAAHFMVRSAALSTERVSSLARSEVTAGASSPLSYWRTTARKLERGEKEPTPCEQRRQNRFTQLMRRTTNSEIHHHQSVTGDHHLSGTGDHHLNVTGDHHASVTGDHHPSVTDQNSSDDHLATFGVMRPLPKF